MTGSTSTRLVIGDHDPSLMQADGYVAYMTGAFWVECECSWISPGAATRDTAMAMHARHRSALDGES